MKKHNGMRPQDIAILMKIISLSNEQWQQSTLSYSLSISSSEVSESLNRNKIAKLIDFDRKKVLRQNLMEFLEHGIKYVFPIQPSAMVRGVPTAHSHPSVQSNFISDLNYVWPDTNGSTIGLAIEPLYQKQVEAVKIDAVLYELLACIDIVRVGKIREVNIALALLKKHILHESL